MPDLRCGCAFGTISLTGIIPAQSHVMDCHHFLRQNKQNLASYLFGGMAADVAGVVSCWAADRSGDLPTFTLRENGC